MVEDKRQLARYNKVIAWICRVMVAIAAVVVAIMMFFAVADVCGVTFSTNR